MMHSVNGMQPLWMPVAHEGESDDMTTCVNMQ